MHRCAGRHAPLAALPAACLLHCRRLSIGALPAVQFIDPEFTKPWRRNVVALYGFDYYDR